MSLLWFQAKCFPSKRSLKKRLPILNLPKKWLLFVKNLWLATSYPDVCTAYMMYMAVPVTVAKAKRPFSKFKLIENFFEAPCPEKDLASKTEKFRVSNHCQ